jgi:4-amino-4-deoxy-L-arabinose transferase-like glycosyltransferase
VNFRKEAFPPPKRYETPAMIALSVAICILISVHLHDLLALFGWVTMMGIWGWFFAGPYSIRSEQRQAKASEYISAGTFIILSSAAAARLYQLAALPLGAFVDEIFTLNSSLLLLEKPIDVFGHTLVLSQAWGKDHPNLYLYFNLVVLKFLGVGYWTTKLLSVVPGVVACGVVFLIGQRLFGRQAALATGLLFAFAHWSIRLNRYGWDVSIMILAFATALWLGCLALQSGRPIYAYLSGIAAGLGLYSYLASRIVALSLVAFWVLEFMLHRDDGRTRRQAAAFTIGTAAAAYPFLNYYFLEPGGFWSRTSEVSVFGVDHPLATIGNNILRHALMFHWMGGTFARDNIPGLPMMDIVTGLVFLAGLIVLVRRVQTPIGRLLWCTLLLNLAAGVLSNSQEGAPYVYRTAAVIVPAFLIVGFGLEWLAGRIGQRWLWVVCSATIALNLYLYFGLEARNIAAMRVMAYEPRLIGLEISRDSSPVWLINPDVLRQTQTRPRPGEEYPGSNPAVLMPPALTRLAIINFSGRYDLARTVSQNLENPKDIHFIEAPALPGSPAKIIFKSDDNPVRQEVMKRGALLRDIPDVNGNQLLTVATLH